MTGERVERRLAAILAADVVGYTRLVSADEADALSRLSKLRRDVIEPNIAGHSGRLFKVMGDGFLAEFASAVQAVSCALAIQTETEAAASGFDDAQKIRLRIGIHVGDVMVEGEDLMGDGINIAARLESIAAAGGISVSRAVHDQVRDRVKITFDDKGEVALKNIARPVQVFAVAGAMSAALVKAAPSALALPDKPSIAVLPFQNMSGDPEQEYFADGMVEDIITALTRFKSLFVIARNSSFTYKGNAVDIKQVGRELGVRYVLEGSVRKAGGRVRITGQLIEAATGAHIWADRIDGALEGVFELQDEVTQRVVGAIEPSITQAEIARAKVKSTSNLDAYDLYLKALSVHYSQTRTDVDEAIRLLEHAITLDPGYAWAKAFAAYVHVLRGAQGWATPEDAARAKALAREAIQSSRDEPNTIGYAAHALAWLTHEYDFSLAVMDRAIHLNPNSFNILMRSGWLRTWVADVDPAIDHFLRSIRLNPVDPQLGFAYGGLAYAYIIKGDYKKALEYARRTAHEMPRYLTSWVTVAIAAASLGNRQEAHEAKQRILEIMPGYSLATRFAMTVFRDQWVVERVMHGLRLAGLPED